MTRKQQLSGKFSNPELKLDLRQLELNALLEVTQAINANLPEDALYRIYHFTLISNLHISKLALYVLDEKWECKANYGCTHVIKNSVISEAVLSLTEISPTQIKGFEEFDVVIPVSHKDKNLAFVFIGGHADIDVDETDSVLSFVRTLSSILIVAIENKKLARKQLQQEALRKELEIASKVQNNLFPLALPDNDKIKIRASYLPHLMVGGDYYDYIELSPDKYLFCIADVSGKGIPAAILMSSVQAALRTLVRRTIDLKDIVQEINYLVKQNAKGDRFITFFIAIADLSARTLSYINAGHNPPVLIKGEKLRLLEKGTTVLGAFDQLPFIDEEKVEIKKGSFVFAYTDGLTETNNEEEEEYGGDRLIEFLKRHAYEDSTFLHEILLRELAFFKGKNNFPDDITILSCKFS